MKTNKSTAAKAGDEAAAGRKKKRKRLSGVRGRVLELLASGPMTSAQLVSAGGFSAASLYLNLKALKKDGAVDTKRDGRSVVISLAGGAGAPAEAAAAPAPRGKRGRPRGSRNAASAAPAALVSAYVPRELAKALEGLSRRLSPVERLDDKLLVLQQLSRSLQGPVSGVLQEIITDLGRFGGVAA